MEQIIPLVFMIIGVIIAIYMNIILFRTILTILDPDWSLAYKYSLLLQKEVGIRNTFVVRKRSLSIELHCRANLEEITPKLPEIYRLFEHTDLSLTPKRDGRRTLIEMPIKRGTPKKPPKPVQAPATQSAPVPA